MPPLSRPVNTYRLFWLAVLLVFIAAVYYFLFVLPRSPGKGRVKPEEVQTAVVEDRGNPPEQQAEAQQGPVKVDVSGASLTLSSSDGSLQMRVWAEQAVKNGQVYALNEGALQFVLANRDTLLVRVTDAKLQADSSMARVDGALLGHLVSSGQYFSAKHLLWSLNEKYVTVEDITYIGPSIEVHGRQMRIDLASGTIDFQGSVEAGV